MKRIWQLDNTQVYLTGIAEEQDVGFEGYAITPQGRHIHWKAWPRPQGYELDIQCVLSMNGASVTQTSTWNLGLELSSFIARSFK